MGFLLLLAPFGSGRAGLRTARFRALAWFCRHDDPEWAASHIASFYLWRPAPGVESSSLLWPTSACLIFCLR